MNGTNARMWQRLEAAAISASESPAPGTGALVVDGVTSSPTLLFRLRRREDLPKRRRGLTEAAPVR